jgi:Na+/H+ antiporter NhaD/arsenite permease-like protein
VSSKRWKIVKGVDWRTLLFFVSMFILMKAVWISGIVQQVLQQTHAPLTNTGVVLMVSVLLSQVVSNVPLVALLQPMLLHAGASNSVFLALAAGSTIAGNMLILGAASNVIILQQAESKGVYAVSFREFAVVGIPLTLLQTGVYWFWLTVVCQ